MLTTFHLKQTESTEFFKAVKSLKASERLDQEAFGVVVCSDFSLDSFKRYALGQGADAFLELPFDHQRLKQMLAEKSIE